MQIISELEPDARGLYTGALGWFDAPSAGQALGDFCLSVPIRTLVLQEERDGARRGMLGVGAGIVHDSDAQAEFAECALKARFLTGLPNNFALIETMHATSNGCRHFDRHMARLRASARYFNISFDEEGVCRAVECACTGLPAGQAVRMRLALERNGRFELQTGALAPLVEPVRVLLAANPVRSDDLFLRHKTTQRARYDAAWKEAEQQGAFDMLFFNERGELTEGARSNVFVRLDGRWFTPPLRAGLLPGVMRSAILSDPAWSATERSVTLDDLRRAEEVIVCNALRGALQAELVWQAPD